MKEEPAVQGVSRGRSMAGSGTRETRRVELSWHKKYTMRSLFFMPRPGLQMNKLGEFELLVLLSVLRQEENAYANRVREDLQENAGRKVTRGALYRTLDRLTEKGFLRWALEPSEIPERGGHPMRRLWVTEAGLVAVRQARDTLLTFFDGVGAVLDEA